jgi:hypothetical protein
MKYFGDATGSPFYAQLPRAEADEVVGKRCDDCGKPVGAADSALVTGGDVLHRECVGRAFAKVGIV